ncbi:MAG: SIS domain-containing protein, partial [Phycisphaerales bacterium]|nr:SIS domain-containing protein [Phycisphaerales bacterium]
MKQPDAIRRQLNESAAVIAGLETVVSDIDAVINVVLETLDAGGTIYTCGNGGSAAEALHLAEELIGCYRDRQRPALRAVCLNADPTTLTCIANDFGYEQVFARQCEALLRPGDALVVLSTSGNSPNLVHALEHARSLDAHTLGFLGRTGGRCRPLCDQAVCVPSDTGAHVQEAHLVLVHLICECVEGWV